MMTKMDYQDGICDAAKISIAPPKLTPADYRTEKVDGDSFRLVVILVSTGKAIHVGTLKPREAKFQREYHMKRENYKNGHSVIPW